MIDAQRRWWHAGTTSDDAGRRVPLVDPLALFAAGAAEPIERESLDTIVSSMHDGRRRVPRLLLRVAPWAMTAAALLVVVLAAAPLLRGTPSGRAWIDVARGAAVGPLLLASAAGAWTTARRADAGRRRQALVAHRRCAHCGHDLNAATETDGLACCGECGCRWRLGPMPARPARRD